MMKHNLLTALLLTLLSLPSFAQLNCDYIDPVCQKAHELMEQGQYDQALRGLEKAKSDPGIRNCSDAYKIDNLIAQIQKKQASIPDASSISTHTSLSCPDSNHPHLIDLGLPSGTKWACCNVGASRPEDYGGYYAWGETTTKSTYDWTNYKWCQGTADKLTKYCTQSSFGTVDNKTVLDLTDDTARANWGGSWCIPTLAQCNELFEKCTHVWTTVNGVNGMKFTSSTGASIFLPAAGLHGAKGLEDYNSKGYYWSSSLSVSFYTAVLNFNSMGTSRTDCYRSIGLSVRPVHSNNQQSNTDNSEMPRSRTYTVNGVLFKMIDVEGGSFDMGSNSVGVAKNEKPVHRVTLSDYSIGETEVTQALWQAVMGNNPSHFSGNNLPVEDVAWDDCHAFIRKLNAATEGQRPAGREFRLPTEAEWEFAARGGNKSRHTQYAGSSSLGDVAWYFDNSNECTHPVAQKAPNEIGLYDMTGNVYEWCYDWYDEKYYRKSPKTNPCNEVKGSYRVFRGGGYRSTVGNCRVSYRHTTFTYKDFNLGFRLAL